MITFTETHTDEKCQSCLDSLNGTKKFLLSVYNINSQKHIIVCDKCLTEFNLLISCHREKYDEEFRRKYYDNV